MYPFRQPIGFAIVRILDERTSRLEERTSRLPLDERTEHHLFSRSLKITPIKCTFYAMKQTFNDSTLGRYGIVWWIQFGCYLYLLHYTTLHYTTLHYTTLLLEVHSTAIQDTLNIRIYSVYPLEVTLYTVTLTSMC